MLSVKGSLRRHLGWWKTNIASKNIIEIVEHGFTLPLLEVPQQTFLKNNKSAYDNADFVTVEIQRLVSTGILQQVTKPPTVVNALTVAVNASGKQRLVLDLRSINPILKVQHYKYEDINTASMYFKKGYMMATFDLKSGYHHVDIHPAYTQYLGLCWDGNFYKY
jgi:hypothetical protein